MRSLKESINLKIQMDALEARSRQQNGILPSPTELSTTLHIFPSSMGTSSTVSLVQGIRTEELLDQGDHFHSPGDKHES